ncbi:MAG TPA: DUF2934 domain-containing protein [Halothiobacillus sp.]|nr:DUF2934 domain-containing protein [Halothiobacillus sp.]
MTTATATPRVKKARTTASGSNTSPRPSRTSNTKASTSRDTAVNSVEHIALAAYYKAEARGFAPGHELNDWLEAEQELSQ